MSDRRKERNSLVILRLALRNIKEGGLRTYLNVAALVLVILLIIGFQGLFDGMLASTTRAIIEDEVAGGQFWHENYDPYDPLSIEDSHGRIPEKLRNSIKEGEAEPVLIRLGTIYPQGRMQTALIRGIDPKQKVLSLPTETLLTENTDLPVMIGTRMARNMKLKEGESLIIRWRDSKGTFDAAEGRIVSIMNTQVPAIDEGNLWVPLDRLQEMTALPGEATIIIMGSDTDGHTSSSGWNFRSRDHLMSDIREIVRTKRISSLIIYLILLFSGMLAIFDTQVLSLFRRRREIGTLIALGMTRQQVIALFTLEGMLYGIIALAVSILLGLPLLFYLTSEGIALPEIIDSYGIAMGERLYPVYSFELVAGTVILIMSVVTVVSFIPTRTIARLNPTQAIQGKIT